MSNNPLNVTQDNIWEYKQNKPSLIAKDFAELFGIAETDTYAILLARGVFKWLAVRRDLIKFKDELRKIITKTIAEIHQAKKEKDRDRLMYLRGRLSAIEFCRNTIRDMCHSDRFRAPDNDRGAQKYLDRARSRCGGVL